MIQKAYKKCANKKRLAGNCKGVLSGADETVYLAFCGVGSKRDNRNIY